MWCDNDTESCFNCACIFLAARPPPFARIAVGRGNWRSQQKLASVGFGIARNGHHKETLPLSTAKILWVWALQGYVAMGSAEIWRGRALQGYSAVGRCKNTLRLLLVTATMFCGWAVHGHLVVGHCRDSLQPDTAEILGGWAL